MDLEPIITPHDPEYWERRCREMGTSAEVRDPAKPIIIEGEGDEATVRANPDYNPHATRKRGTSFFFCFDPCCRLHQLPGPEGNEVREIIIALLHERFADVFASLWPDAPPSALALAQLAQMARVELRAEACDGFDNGEIYFWLPRVALTRDFTLRLTGALWDSLTQNPFTVTYQGQSYPVLFYGCGFRFY